MAFNIRDAERERAAHAATADNKAAACTIASRDGNVMVGEQGVVTNGAAVTVSGQCRIASTTPAPRGMR